jgi:dolichyl-phosphate-mannose--protein O-mannosyl transferase
MRRIPSLALIAILGCAALVRFYRLGRPDSLVFDELYYVDGARDYLKYGVEVTGNNPEFIVHPPVGKWLISIGIAIFGDTSFGWRAAGALIGLASVLLIYLIAKKLFSSELIALLAASLMAIDGLAIVMSRTALLDNTLTFFILLSFYLLIRKNYLLVGLALGLAVATKWSGLYVLIAFSIIALIQIWRNRGQSPLPQQFLKIILGNLISISVYLISWLGWLISDRGWARDSSSNPLVALWNYHREIYGFHSTLTVEHNYRSHPWSWLVMGRPTSFFYESPSGCGSDQCSQEILALGNPLIWWFATIAIAALIGYWLHRRDEISTLILIGFFAGYLPWFFFPDRTMFTFYAVVILPFLILAIAYLADELLRRYRYARRVITLGFTLVFLLFLYFLPIQIGGVISYDQWQARMWLESWI